MQNTPTGSGNDFHTRQTHPWKITFSYFVDDIPSIIDLMKSPRTQGAGIAILGGEEWIEGGAFRIRDRGGIG